jgi:hypothetical protein
MVSRSSFDLAVSLSYWVEATGWSPMNRGKSERVCRPRYLYLAAFLPHFFTRREFMERYARKSGLDL